MSSQSFAFVSYSPKDKAWLEELNIHLSPLLKRTGLALWDDTQISPGAVWKDETQKALNAATIAILLVSPDFLASDYIDKNQLPPLLEAAQTRGLTIFWIPIRASAYRYTEIEKYQPAHSPDHPLSHLSQAEQDRVWLAILDSIDQEIKKTRVARPLRNPPALAPSLPVSAVPAFEFDVVTVDAQGQEIDRQNRQAEYRQENLGYGVFLEMVAIPKGEFLMGAAKKEPESSDDERPQHWVTVPRLFMGKYPVTQIQWRMVAALPRVNRSLNAEPLDDQAEFEGDNRPIVNVSWHDAVEFCDRLTRRTQRTYRLPTEAEWEYACRAGTSTPFHFGETITPDLVNYDGNYPYGAAAEGEYRQKTTDVDSFGVANLFGLYDLHGNVWEWCEDHWHENYEGAPIDGKAWLIQDADADHPRLLRGGSWSYDSWGCRSAYRFYDNPDGRDYYYGFRVVCSSAWTL